MAHQRAQVSSIVPTFNHEDNKGWPARNMEARRERIEHQLGEKQSVSEKKKPFLKTVINIRKILTLSPKNEC